jgi:hypothetical protein
MASPIGTHRHGSASLIFRLGNQPRAGPGESASPDPEDCEGSHVRPRVPAAGIEIARFV